MPMGQFKDFDACVRHYVGQGKSKESAERICGAIKHSVEGLRKDRGYDDDEEDEDDEDEDSDEAHAQSHAQLLMTEIEGLKIRL